MKRLKNRILLLAACTAALLATSACSEDFSGDIDDLNEKVSKIDSRVTNLETQANKMNSELEKLAVLTTAVEKGFYVTDVKTTDEGYELTLNNGRKISLANGPSGALTSAPIVSTMPIDGLYYWTLNGMLINDSEGRPIRANGQTPKVKYDTTNQVWLFSTDGINFQRVSVFANIVINDEVLMQIINNYVSQHSTTLFTNEMLYQIISTYIQQNYATLFNTEIMTTVVQNYVNNHYTTIFSSQVLKQVLNQYITENSNTFIDTDVMTNILVSFIEQNKTTIINNEVLTKIFNTYIEQNQTNIFSNELLFQVINNYIAHNENIVNVEMLRQVINNYIEQNQTTIINTEVISNVFRIYLQNYYTQVFNNEILYQVVNNYIQQNQTTIFNQTLLQNILSVFVQNNYNTFITNEAIQQIINNYIQNNHTTIIDVDVIRNIVYTYVQQNIYSIFDVDILTQIITNYFQQNTTVINQYVNVFKSVNIKEDLVTIILNNGTELRLVVYDYYARLRDRVQSIVYVPTNAEGTISYTQGPKTSNTLRLQYFVTPTSMASLIAQRFQSRSTAMSMLASGVYYDGSNAIAQLPVTQATGNANGLLTVTCSLPTTAEYSTLYAFALYVKDSNAGGSDYTTVFIPTATGNGEYLVDKPNTYDKRLLGKWKTSEPWWLYAKKEYRYCQWTFYDSGTCALSAVYSHYSANGTWTDEEDLIKNGTWQTTGDNTLYVTIDGTTYSTTYTIDGQYLSFSSNLYSFSSNLYVQQQDNYNIFRKVQ